MPVRVKRGSHYLSRQSCVAKSCQSVQRYGNGLVNHPAKCYGLRVEGYSMVVVANLRTVTRARNARTPRQPDIIVELTCLIVYG